MVAQKSAEVLVTTRKKATKAQLAALVRAQEAWRIKVHAERLERAIDGLRALPRDSRQSALERLRSRVSGKVVEALATALK
jgi:hypothetical protein